MPPAARKTDLCTCPKCSGGEIIEGSSSISFEGQPAALVGDAVDCEDGPSYIGSGSASVTIDGRAVARVGDNTCHHGVIKPPGAPSVIIGDGSSFPDEDAAPGAPAATPSPASAMTTARANGAPFLRP
jgi:uncharacterized Zn-binding protein involved in type VI secretion